MQNNHFELAKRIEPNGESKDMRANFDEADSEGIIRTDGSRNEVELGDIIERQGDGRRWRVKDVDVYEGYNTCADIGVERMLFEDLKNAIERREIKTAERTEGGFRAHGAQGWVVVKQDGDQVVVSDMKGKELDKFELDDLEQNAEQVISHTRDILDAIADALDGYGVQTSRSRNKLTGKNKSGASFEVERVPHVGDPYGRSHVRVKKGAGSFEPPKYVHDVKREARELRG